MGKAAGYREPLAVTHWYSQACTHSDPGLRAKSPPKKSATTVNLLQAGEQFSVGPDNGLLKLAEDGYLGTVSFMLGTVPIAPFEEGEEASTSVLSG